MENKKCPIHNEVFAYYCIEDGSCICASCHVAEEHQGHKMETLDEASEKKQQKLRNVLQTLIAKREEIELREQRMQGCKKVDFLLRDLWKHLEYVEKSALSEISSREEQAGPSVTDLIRQLVVKKDEISKKMGHLEELFSMTNPLTCLQESDSGDFYDPEKEDVEFSGSVEKQILGNEIDRNDYFRMNEALRGISAAVRGINVDFLHGIRSRWKVDLDKSTAANNLQISEGLDTASQAELNVDLSDTPVRFRDHPQVLSIMSVSSGRHYWTVSFRKSIDWGVGMCYPSMDRAGVESLIGNNEKSWCVRQVNSKVSAEHGGESATLPKSNIETLKMHLNYEAGQLSFYAEGDWFIEHLHTFTTTFTEPLHVVLYVGHGSVRLEWASTIGTRE